MCHTTHELYDEMELWQWDEVQHNRWARALKASHRVGVRPIWYMEEAEQEGKRLSWATATRSLRRLKALGISPTTLKRACRKVGIFKWPFRLLENEKMEEAAARMLRLLNPRPNIPATDPTSDCSRNSTPYSSPASNVSTDMCISDHRPYRIPNQADITQAVRLLTEENVENRRHLLREQEENRRLLRM